MTDEWATITDATTIASEPICNETIVKMMGTDSLAVDLATLLVQNDWASGTDTLLLDYTDGYRVYVTMTIQTAPQILDTTNAPYNNGICFGEVDPITNGGYCFIY